MGFFICCFFLFFYVYSVQFVFIPGGVGTRVILGILGGFIYCYSNIKNWTIYISRDEKKYICALFFILFVSLVSIVFNSTNDIAFVKYPISLIIIYLAAYFIQYIFKLKNKYDLYSIINCLSYVVAFQILLSFLIFFIPSLKDFVMSVQKFSTEEEERLLWNGSIRLIGLGSTFFGAGIINGFVLILLGYKIKNKPMNFKGFLHNIVMYVFILFGGILMSRTTIIGFLFSLLILCEGNWRYLSYKFRFMLRSLVFLILIVVVLSNTLFVDYREDFETLFSYGFEMVENLQDDGTISSASTNRLLEMYETYPDNLKTIIIGDGYYDDPNGDGYYKQIDIGYYRLIFYFGIVGLICYFTFQYHVVKMAITNFPSAKKIFFIAFLFLLTLNFKGFTDIVYLLLLFTFNPVTFYKNVKF